MKKATADRLEIPVASVVTQTHLKEFLLLKFSLERYHPCVWYLTCDEYSFNALKNFDGCKCRMADIENGEQRGSGKSLENFYRVMLQKFNSSREALKSHPYVLLVDSDIIFTNPIDCKFSEFVNSDLDVIVSPHYQWDAKIDASWGKYNSGFAVLKSTKFIDAWENLTLKNIYPTVEQLPMTKVIESNEFKFDEFPINYNMGWWRFRNKASRNRFNSFGVKNGKITYDGFDVVNFHFHTFLEHKHSLEFKDIIFNILRESEHYAPLLSKYEELKQL